MIKGKYIANIEIEFETKHYDRPFEDIKRDIEGDAFTDALRCGILDLLGENCSVEMTPMCAYLELVDDTETEQDDEC